MWEQVNEIGRKHGEIKAREKIINKGKSLQSKKQNKNQCFAHEIINGDTWQGHATAYQGSINTTPF